MTIFRYPGGKSKESIQKKIFAHFPKKYSEFRDAMVGGGGIFFAISPEIPRWINDKDEYLMQVYLALRDRPDEFIGSCRSIAAARPGEPLVSSTPGGKPLYNGRLKAQFDHLIEDGGEDAALRYLFVNRTVWSGRVNYDLSSRLYFSNPQGWKVVHTKKMETAAELVKGVKITVGDYEEVLLKEGNDVVVYVDPPYFTNTLLANTSKLYRCNFEVSDHDRLRKVIGKSKHKVVISYDDHPHIQELYRDLNVNSVRWTYCGTSSAAGQSKVKKVGKELIITNF